KQIFKNFELIAIDDGSDEQIYSGKKSYIDSLNDKRFKLLRNITNRGIAATINRGIETASGQYITWVSDDNDYFPNYLKILYNPSYDFIYSQWELNDTIRRTKNIVKM